MVQYFAQHIYITLSVAAQRLLIWQEAVRCTIGWQLSPLQQAHLVQWYRTQVCKLQNVKPIDAEELGLFLYMTAYKSYPSFLLLLVLFPLLLLPSFHRTIILSHAMIIRYLVQTNSKYTLCTLQFEQTDVIYYCVTRWSWRQEQIKVQC